MRQRIQERNERGKDGGSGGVLVVGGEVASALGFVAASPNEEARIAREVAEASRLERLRQVRLQVCLFLPPPPRPPAYCSASRHFPFSLYLPSLIVCTLISLLTPFSSYRARFPAPRTSRIPGLLSRSAFAQGSAVAREHARKQRELVQQRYR